MHRVADLLNRQGIRFKQKLFTDPEITYCDSKALPAIHFAGRFAAKEALKKALISGKILDNISLKNIEILNDETGAPIVIIHHTDYTFTAAQVSISHTDDQAIAFALIRK